MLILGKLNTKEKLREVNIIRDDQTMCPLSIVMRKQSTSYFLSVNILGKFGALFCHGGASLGAIVISLGNFLISGLALSFMVFKRSCGSLYSLMWYGVVGLVREEPGCFSGQEYKLGECKLYI